MTTRHANFVRDVSKVYVHCVFDEEIVRDRLLLYLVFRPRGKKEADLPRDLTFLPGHGWRWCSTVSSKLVDR